MGNNIKAVIFDYGGVISLPQNEKIAGKMCRLLDITMEQLKSVYLTTRMKYDEGVITAAEYWKNIIDVLGINEISDGSMDKLVSLDAISWQVINGNTVSIIKKLKKKGYKLALLSNMTYDTLPFINNSKWIKYFEVKVFSCEEKTCKPDERIYRIVLERLCENPEDTLFIDDSPVNIEAAGRLGINVIHYRRGSDFIGELEMKLNLNSTK